MSVKLLLIALAVVVCAVSPAALSGGDSSASNEDQQTTNTRQCLQQNGLMVPIEQLGSTFPDMPICFQSHFNLAGFVNDSEGLNDTNRVEFFDRYCPQFHESLRCVNPMLEQLRKCWEAEELPFLDIVINLLPEAVSLICKDRGEIFYRASLQDESVYPLRCLDRFDYFVVECASKVSESTDVMYISKFGKTQCEELQDFRSCISDRLHSCKTQVVMDLFDLFYRPLVKASPCNKFIDLEEHKAVGTNEI